MDFREDHLGGQKPVHPHGQRENQPSAGRQSQILPREYVDSIGQYVTAGPIRKLY